MIILFLIKKNFYQTGNKYLKQLFSYFFRCQHSLNGNNLKSEEIEKERLLLEFYTLGKKVLLS